jgi:hypothetical protein
VSRSTDELLHGHFDGTLDEFERAELGRLLATDATLADRFVDVAILEHALAEREEWHEATRAVTAAPPPPVSSPRRHRLALNARRSAVAAIVVVLLALSVNFFSSSQTAAAALARIAEQAHASDRQYVLHALERERSWAIDGAMLAVRDRSAYVLRTLPEKGDGRIVGSDGSVAWSIPLTGPVRVSSDPGRFRGWLPGSQHGVPFLADALDVESLAATYELRFAESSTSGRASVRATRKPDARRGPRAFTIDYDPVTFDILRMQLDGLPRARGGPESVELVLESHTALAADYFSHEHHHARDRRVVRDD